MPHPVQPKASDAPSHAQTMAQQCWEELVTQHWPANLQDQARALGAFQRVRAVGSAHVLLRAFLCNVLSLSSLKHLSGWSRMLSVSSQVISAQAWHKRLPKAGPWLLWLFPQMVTLPLAAPRQSRQQRMLLVDATHLTEIGPKGEANELRRQITDAEPLHVPVSRWQRHQWAWASLRNVITGWWSPQQLRALAPAFRRLFTDRRQRPLREHHQRVRFLPLLERSSDLVSLFDCSGTFR
jgi:hypothetical protein